MTTLTVEGGVSLRKAGSPAQAKKMAAVIEAYPHASVRVWGTSYSIGYDYAPHTGKTRWTVSFVAEFRFQAGKKKATDLILGPKYTQDPWVIEGLRTYLESHFDGKAYIESPTRRYNPGA